jgi:hypothetical protein
MLLPAATSHHATHTHPTACRTCRRRGRKCDKTLPSCQSCKDKSVVCEGYVTRWAGVAARGRLRGRTIPVLLDEDNNNNGRRTVKKASSSSTTGTVRSPPVTACRKHRSPPPQDVPSESPPASAMLAIERMIPGSSDGLDSFIDYCESRVPSRSFPLSETEVGTISVNQLLTIYALLVAYDVSAIPYLGSKPEESPYRLYVHPLTDRVLPLRYAVAASAACHLACRFRNEALKAKGREWQLKAMELMRQRLESKAMTADFGTLLSILTMAQMDVRNPCLGRDMPRSSNG